ncbi:hypothetical protein D3C86_1298930 [compost metagenome]
MNSRAMGGKVSQRANPLNARLRSPRTASSPARPRTWAVKSANIRLTPCHTPSRLEKLVAQKPTRNRMEIGRPNRALNT